MTITTSSVVRLACALVLALGLTATAGAVTTGKIAGTVIDKATGEPLPAASIRVEGTTMGAMADDKGRYFILNLPPGRYDLVVHVIGYVPLRVKGVRVIVDLTTFQDFALEPTVLEVVDPVEVIAERSLVEKSLTSSRTILEGEEIQSSPVNNIEDVVLTTPGSLAGALRGGLLEERQITLDGAVVTAQRENAGTAFTVNPLMIQEMEVRTGTYNAEYANAMTGIVSMVTGEGGSKFSGSLAYRTLGQKGLNHTTPPDIDLVARVRTGILNEGDLRDIIRTSIDWTNGFNTDPARQEDGLELRFPFDVAFDTSAADPGDWDVRYSRRNYYWDYDRLDALSMRSYLTHGLPEARANSFSVDRSFHPDKYNAYARHNRTEKRPVQLDWAMGGPIGPKLNWFFSGRFSESWGRLPDAYDRVMSFFGKMTLRPTGSTKLTLSGLLEDNGFFSGKGMRIFDTRAERSPGGQERFYFFDTIYQGNSDVYNFRHNMDGLNRQFNGRLHVNLAFTHALSDRTFYEFRCSHLREYAESYNPKYGKSPPPDPTLPENLENIGYNPVESLSWLPKYFVYGDETYASLNGIFTNSRPFRTDLSWSVTSQVTVHHQFKAGAGVTLHDYQEQRRGMAPDEVVAPALFSDLNASETANVVRVIGWEYHVYPTEYFLYAQDRIEYGGLTVNAGIRLDIFDPKTNYADPFRPYPGPEPEDVDPQYLTMSPSVKTAVSPRLGVSHSIGGRAALHYSYGVFHQRPPLSRLYDGLVGTRFARVLVGNPDLPFMRSDNYEMGVQAEIYPGYYLDVTGYYRDTSHLPGIFAPQGEKAFGGVYYDGPEGATGGEPSFNNRIGMWYPLYAQDARGLEISFRRAMAHRFSIRANYTLGWARDTTPIFGLVTTNRIVPSNSDVDGWDEIRYFRYWSNDALRDRRHRLVTNLMVDLPFGISASFLTEAQSGHPYFKPYQGAGVKGRSPWTTTTDLYAQKEFRLGGARLGVFTQIDNLFNRRNIYYVAVVERHPNTGGQIVVFSQDEDYNLTGDTGASIQDMGTQQSMPRDIWVGVRLAW